MAGVLLPRFGEVLVRWDPARLGMEAQIRSQELKVQGKCHLFGVCGAPPRAECCEFLLFLFFGLSVGKSALLRSFPAPWGPRHTRFAPLLARFLIGLS